MRKETGFSGNNLTGILIACLIFLNTSFSLATDRSIFDLQEELKNRIMPVITAYDKYAFVLVTVTPRKVNRTLPFIPFASQKITIRDEKGFPELASIEVRIFTRETKIPESISNIIKNLVSHFGTEAKLIITPIPPEILKRMSGVGHTFTNIFENPMALVALFFGILAILYIGFRELILWKKRQGSADAMQALETGLQKLTSTIEDVAPGARGQAAKETARSREKGKLLKTEGSSERNSVIESFSEESIEALLSDCYRGEYDNYASYIWKQTPVKMRHSLFSRIEFLNDYARFIADLEEENLGLEQDPCYLKPLPITHLNNAKLTELVKENPDLIGQLSNLRVDALDLSVRERIELGSKSDTGKKLPDFAAIEASPPRQLKRNTRLQISTIEEERELLSMENVSMELKESLPSLGWFLDIDKKRAEEILAKYSARDLATAWIGPDEVLDELITLLPGKKQELMRSYLTKTSPDRNSATFLGLHYDVLTAIKAPPPEEEVVDHEDLSASMEELANTIDEKTSEETGTGEIGDHEETGKTDRAA